jgi:phosphatidylglycerol---prolipoprotein diacylglyceryl transferase
VQPDAFSIGTLTVHWYGVLVALGFLAGIWTASRRAPLAGILPDKVFELGPWLLVGTLAGARFLYVVTFWREQFAGHSILDWFRVWEGGLVYYGGLAGASAGYVFGSRRNEVPLWTGADVLAPSIALGQAFGRLGCVMYGCCYGKECGLPWALRYPMGHPTHPTGSASIPVHPAPLYEAVLCLGLYAALAWLFRRRKFEGQVFAAFLVGYAAVRFGVECFRGDYLPGQMLMGGRFTPAHLVSLGIVAIGMSVFFVLRAKAPRITPPG